VLEVSVRNRDERFDDIGTGVDRRVDVALERPRQRDDLRVGRATEFRDDGPVLLARRWKRRLNERNAEVVERTDALDLCSAVYSRPGIWSPSRSVTSFSCI